MLKNNVKFDKVEVQVHFGDSAVQFLDDEWFCEGITTDSREVINDTLFIALVGDNTDGHDYVNQALEKGASAVVVSNDWYKDNIDKFQSKPLIVVKDTLVALGRFATMHRRRFMYPIVVIGGSNGKTTTKDMTSTLLSEKFNVLSTYKNFNNRIGVPLMLLQMTEEHDMAVLEIGTNEPGEIAILTDMVEPSHGLITNIGNEHLEKLIDLDGVEMEETYIYGFLHKTNGICFINYDDERLKKYNLILDEAVSYSTSDENSMINSGISLADDLRASLKIEAAERVIDVKLNSFGYTTALNALAASAIGLHLGLEDGQIKSGLEKYKPDDSGEYGRMLVETIDNFTLLNDCYNANPESMKSALNNLNLIKGNLKIAVLADMRELGENSLDYHKELIEYALEKADRILLFGEQMGTAQKEFKSDKIKLYSNKDEIVPDLKATISESDVILVKGSRGLQMEEVINKLKNK